ncbi:MAG: hypothetical protein ACRDKZ_15180 [Actinomycetota bacterium]
MRLAVIGACALLFAACFPGDQNLTESGEGKPVVAADFPATVQPGSTNDLTIEVSNPGPGDIDSVLVAFALVGIGGEQGNARPLVVPGARDDSPSVDEVEPEPVGVGEGGTIYRFGGLAVDGSGTYRFEIVTPDEPGTYANSLQVYDGADPQRIDGLRLQTEVAP